MNTGSVLAQFTITLSQAVSEQVAVEWHTADGTALAGVDYAAAKGTVLFAPGQTAKTVDILVHGRAVGSEDRSFFVEMLPPTNAILGASIGECFIHVDTTGSTPVTQIIVPTGPRGLQGDSAYQTWLDLGNTGTEQDFIDSLSPSAEEIAEEVAPLLNVGNSPVTAEDTETLGNPDGMTVKRLARRVAYVGATKVATVTLADGDNLITHSDLTGDAVDFNSISLYPRILRGTVFISPEWSVEPGNKILIKSAVAGDVLHVCQYDVISDQAAKNVLATIGSQAFEALRRSYAEAGYNVVNGSFEAGGTVTTTKEVLLHEVSGKAYSYNGTLPHTVAARSSPSAEPGMWVDKSGDLLRELLSSNWAQDGGLSIDITDTPLLPSSADNRIKWERSRASLRAGVRDTVPLDDPLSHFRGLIDKNTWDDPTYHGVGSLSFGRNGAAYAYLSTTLGHDCVSYGVAALAGGAGSCTGNPDIPGDGADYGYCSIGWGKYSQALGRISYAFGEECISGSLNSVAMGWKAKTGPCVAGMPNPIGAGPVLSEGRAATALGHYVEAYGDGAAAIGHYIKCYSGAMVFGYGINTGSPITNAIPGAVGIAANSDVMGVQVTPGPGTNGGFSRIGFNTLYPNQRIEAVLKNTDKVAYRLDEGEAGATLSLQRTVGGVISDVVSITFNNSGVGSLVINGQQVVSNRAAAISDSLTLENKVQAMLDTMRYHGLIAS